MSPVQLLRLLSCKPQLAEVILNESGVKEALDGKLLISILAGITMRQLSSWVLPSTRVVRAMPNTPCKVCLFSNSNRIQVIFMA